MIMPLCLFISQLSSSIYKAHQLTGQWGGHAIDAMPGSCYWGDGRTNYGQTQSKQMDTKPGAISFPSNHA